MYYNSPGHPMNGVNQAVLGGLFDNVLNQIKQAGQKSIATSLLQQPAVQQALIDSGKQSLAQELANNLLQTAEKTVVYVQENKSKILMYTALAAVGGIALYYVMSNKRRAATA